MSNISVFSDARECLISLCFGMLGLSNISVFLGASRYLISVLYGVQGDVLYQCVLGC